FKVLVACSVIASLIVTFSLSHEDRNLYVFGLPVFSLAVAVMLFWLVSTNGTIIHKLLENSILRWIGNVSYALYLWHYLMYEYAKKEFATSGIQIFVGVTLAFVLAAVSYYCVEQPFLRLKSRFQSKPTAA
ncbi:MAG: acyltransferase family protein, partial [Acidobacteriota bacterium]